MEEMDPIKLDALERVETESLLTDDSQTNKKSFQASVSSFLKRYSSVLVIVSAVLLFIFTFVAIALSSGRSTIRKNKELLSAEFQKLEFKNFVTTKGPKEDYAKLVAEVLYKVAVKFDPKEEALIYVQFNEFNKNHDKKHTSFSHKKTAYTNYRNNLNQINEHNRKEHVTYTKKMNRYGDLSPKEFLKKYTKKVQFNLNKDRKQAYHNDRPMSLDLRTHGVLTPVKAQGEGELSWAYSTVAVAESYIKKTTHKTLSLSEKQLVDCVSERKAQNNPLMGFKYVKDLGLYKSELVQKTDQKCPALDDERYKIQSYSYSYDPDLIALLLNAGPLTVPVSVSEDWQFYSEGTLNVCGPEMNHYLTLVGVSFDEKGNYWILKNSLGEDWGTKGYVLLTRNSQDYEDDCGLTTFAVYAI